MTLSLPRSAWATKENTRELQTRCRSLLRYMTRHKLLEAFGWVREEGAPRAECVCDRAALNGCICGANGRQLHRHFLLRMPARKGFRQGKWMPFKKLQAAAKRCGLGTLDFRPITNEGGAAAYVSKYLTKTIGEVAGAARRYSFSESIPDIKQPGWYWRPGRVATVAVDQLGALAVDWDATYWEYFPPLTG